MKKNYPYLKNEFFLRKNMNETVKRLALEYSDKGFLFDRFESYPIEGYRLVLQNNFGYWVIIRARKLLIEIKEEYARDDAPILKSECITTEISVQIIDFCLEFTSSQIICIDNWVGWNLCGDITYKYITGGTKGINYLHFKEEKLKIASIDEYLPDFMWPVSSTVLEYAEYTFYDFLVDKIIRCHT